MVKICATEWFNCLSGLVGIVAIEQPNGSLHCFIGNVPSPSSELDDAQYIVQFGAQYPLRAAKHFFPWIQLPLGF